MQCRRMHPARPGRRRRPNGRNARAATTSAARAKPSSHQAAAGGRVRPVGIGSGLHRRRRQPSTAMVSGRRCLGADVCINPQPGEGCAGAHLRARNRGVRTGARVGVHPRPGAKPGHSFRPKTGDIPGIRGALSPLPGIAKASRTKGLRDQSPESPVSPVQFQGTDLRPQNPRSLYL